MKISFQKLYERIELIRKKYINDARCKDSAAKRGGCGITQCRKNMAESGERECLNGELGVLILGFPGSRCLPCHVRDTV